MNYLTIEDISRKTDNLYRFAVEHSNDGFALSDHGLIISVNQKFLDIFGYSRKDEIINEPISDFIHPDDYERVTGIYDRRQRGEKVLSRYEFRGIRKDGQIVEIEVSSKAATYKGKILNIAYFRDITKRKQSQKNITETKERYQALFDNMKNGVAICKAVNNGEDFVFIDFNQAGEKIDSINKKDLIGKRITEVFPGVREFGLLDVLKQVWKTGKSQQHPISMYQDKRITGWRDNYVYKLPTGEIVSIYSDETGKKIADDALKKSEREKRAILQGITSGIQLMNRDYEILWLNKAAGNMVQKSPEEIISKKCYEVTYQKDQPCVNCLMEKVFQNGKSEQTIQYLHNGRIWKQKFEPVFGDSNQVVGVIRISNDITENKHLENQLRHAQKMEAIGTLADGIAHDFSNILYAMLGFTELSMTEVDKNSNIYGFLQEVIKAGDRAKDLIDQILTFSRKTDFTLKPIQINLIINETIKLLKASLPSTIQIQQDIHSISHVMCDAAQIHQIMINLCTNARYAMRETGGELDIQFFDIEVGPTDPNSPSDLKPGSYVLLMVKDTGSGISRDKIEHIFEPFYSTKEKSEGKGLGLSVVHGIVKSLGGKIMVQRQPGQGSTFKVLLPVVEKPEQSDEKLGGPYETGSERILVIDDEKPILKIGELILTSLGYQVTGMSDVYAALKQFQADPTQFDLVLTDMTMPGMTGDKLAIELNKIRKDIPIILCTGCSAEVNREYAAAAGIKSIVSKPIKKAELSVVVRKVLDEGMGYKN